MYSRLAVTAGGLLLGGGLLVGTASPVLAAPCDAYSKTCPSTPPGTINGGGGGPAASTPTPSPSDTVANPVDGSALPFTGAQLVLGTTVGAVALAGGTVLVLAGRRRRLAD